MSYEEAKEIISNMYYELNNKKPSDEMIRIAVGVVSPKFFIASIKEEYDNSN